MHNLRFVRPWQHGWGATDEEVNRQMPGDENIERMFTAFMRGGEVAT